MYTWLGRMGALPGSFSAELTRAWRELCAMVSMPGMSARVQTMLSELCYTRRTPGMLANGVNPGVGVRRHNGFLALTDAQIACDGTNFLRWDVEKHTAATVTAQLRAEHVLRHSSCGIYPNSACYIGSGAQHDANRPCFNSDRYSTPQYLVNQSGHIARIAIAAGIVVKECESDRLNQISDFAIYTQGQSSLMLGIGAWALASVGMPPSVASGYVNISNLSPEWTSHVMSTVSDGFIVDAARRGATGIGSETAQNADYNLSTLVPLMHGLAASTAADLDNVTVPFWYVMAILTKFDFSLDPKTTPNPRRMPAGFGGGRRLVYTFDEDKPWYAQHLIMADPTYEANHWDFAVVPEPDDGFGRAEICWYPDMYIDMTRENVAQAIFAGDLPLPAIGTLSTTMTAGDYISQYMNITERDPHYMKAMVWGNTPVTGDRPTSWPRVIGGLRYPDPFWEWLWEGAQKVGPHILLGNYGSAAAEAFTHLAKPAVEWAGDKIKTWVENRST